MNTWRRAWPLAAGLAALACGRVDTSVGAEIAAAPVYIEAEDGQLSGGFTIESDDPRASGGKYILPPPVGSTDTPGPAAAEYVFRTTQAGVYAIWGRIHGPGAYNNSFWVTVDGVQGSGVETIQWRLSTGVIWYWARLTSGTDYGRPFPFVLDAGLHHLVFRNSATQVGLDRLFMAPLAADGGAGEVPPGNDTPCEPPNSIQLADGTCQASCGALLGTTCGAQVCAGFVQLPAYDCAVCCRVLDLDAGSSDAPVE